MCDNTKKLRYISWEERFSISFYFLFIPKLVYLQSLLLLSTTKKKKEIKCGFYSKKEKCGCFNKILLRRH